MILHLYTGSRAASLPIPDELNSAEAAPLLCAGIRPTVYLMKLPRLPKKLRVMVSWSLDLFFARDIEQMITLRDVEALGDLAGRIRARRAEGTSITAASPLDTAIRDQLK